MSVTALSVTVRCADPLRTVAGLAGIGGHAPRCAREAAVADPGGPTRSAAMAHWSGTPVNEFFNDAAPTRAFRTVTARQIRKTQDKRDTAAMDLVIFLPLLIVMGAFMFFASRRQKKAMQATIDLHNSLRVGDLIHTTSGLRATITGIGDDYVDLEIAPGVVTTWMKLAVRDRVTDDVEDEDAADEDSVDDTVESYSEPISKATEITESPNTKTDS